MAVELSRSNYQERDFWAPKRPMSQFEHNQAATQFGIIGIHTVRNGASMQQLEAAMDRFYDWYPVACKMPVARDGRFWLEDGVVRPTSFAEDVKNNRVIRSREDFYRVVEDTHLEFRWGVRYPFGPRMYKVDMPRGEDDTLLGDGIGYVLMSPGDHGVMEGKSHRVLRNFINGFVEDKDYRPRLPSPQTIPNSTVAFVSRDAPFRDLAVTRLQPVDLIGYEKGSRVDPRKRGLSFFSKRVDKSALVHPKQYALTGCMTGVMNFIYLALLLDYHQGKRSVTHGFNVPYSADHKLYPKVLEGDVKDMMGLDVLSFQMFHTLDRESPLTLYQVLDHADEVYREGMRVKDQAIINTNFAPYCPVEFTPQKEFLLNTVSNFGDLKMRKGVIDTTSAYGFSTFLVGTILLAFCGQPDGTIMMNNMALRSVYPPRFLELYTELLLRLLKLSMKSDITIAQLRELPEYKEMAEIIKDI